MLTDVGSNLGLFLGGSFITVGELIHFILLAVLAICVNPPPAKNPIEETDEQNPEEMKLTREQLEELKQIIIRMKLEEKDTEDEDESECEEIEKKKL